MRKPKRPSAKAAAEVDSSFQGNVPGGQSKPEQLARVESFSAPLVISRRPTSAYQEVRAARAFDLHVQSWSYRRIAAEMGLSLETVGRDIHDEYARRRDASLAKREQHVEMQIARYEREIQKLDSVDVSADMNPGDSHAKVAMAKAKMLERIDKLRGLEAATKIDLTAKVSVSEERKIAIGLIVGNISQAPIRSFLTTLEDTAEIGAADSLRSESAAEALSST